jgi:2'-5' RNA ligase
MKSYLEIQVPLRNDAQWFKTLREACKGIPVRWQKGYFHITMAFLDETPSDVDFVPVISEQLRTAIAPTLTFDKLDVFSTMSGDMYIVNLTCTNIPKTFEDLVNKVRAEFEKQGAVIESDFRLHVTLGRIKDLTISQKEIENILADVVLPSFTLQLPDILYRWFRGKAIGEWHLH